MAIPIPDMKEAVERGRSAAGERNGMAKLTKDGVSLVRSMLRVGMYQKDIAKHVGVSQSAVSLINREKNWGPRPS